VIGEDTQRNLALRSRSHQLLQNAEVNSHLWVSKELFIKQFLRVISVIEMYLYGSCMSVCVYVCMYIYVYICVCVYV